MFSVALSWRVPLRRPGANTGFRRGPVLQIYVFCSRMRRASCVREVTLSLRNTFLRWYLTVPALRKSWAAISLFEAPSVARSATRASWGVRSRLVTGVRRRARAPCHIPGRRFRSDELLYVDA